MTQKAKEKNPLKLFIKYNLWAWFAGLCLCAGVCIGEGSWDFYYTFMLYFGVFDFAFIVIAAFIACTFFIDWDYMISGRWDIDESEQNNEDLYSYADFDVDSDSEKKE